MRAFWKTPLIISKLKFALVVSNSSKVPTRRTNSPPRQAFSRYFDLEDYAQPSLTRRPRRSDSSLFPHHSHSLSLSLFYINNSRMTPRVTSCLTLPAYSETHFTVRVFVQTSVSTQIRLEINNDNESHPQTSTPDYNNNPPDFANPLFRKFNNRDYLPSSKFINRQFRSRTRGKHG